MASFLRQKKILTNLLIMMVIWLVSSFDYFLIAYLVNTFKKVYLSALCSSVSEIVAYAVSGIVYEKYGARNTLASSFGISLVGGVIILVYGLNHQDNWSFFLLVLFAKFGIASSFNIVYVAHCSIFPPLFASTALGYCGVLARIFSSISPLLAQMAEPIPMICFTCTAGLAALLSLGLREDSKEDEDINDDYK